MRWLFIFIAILFNHFSWAGYVSDDDYRQIIECDSRKILFKYGGPGSFFVISTKTNHQTEISCWGQCGIDQWACVSVDNIPYLWFRGVNAERYTVGPIDGHEYMGHWKIQLNEVDFGLSLDHTHKDDLDNFLKLLDETKDDQLVWGEDGLDFNETIHHSKYEKLARKKYSYIGKIYKSAKFSSFDFE